MISFDDINFQLENNANTQVQRLVVVINNQNMTLEQWQIKKDQIKVALKVIFNGPVETSGYMTENP